MGFEQAFASVVGLEGGYVNDQRDPGGETRYGISKRAYPDEDIKNLTLDRAKVLYRRDYWNACRCDELPARLAPLVFDAAVNQGVATAIRLLQQALHITVDGRIGPQTVACAKSAGDELPAMYLAHRAVRYAQTNNFEIFGLGWFKRLFIVALEN